MPSSSLEQECVPLWCHEDVETAGEAGGKEQESTKGPEETKIKVSVFFKISSVVSRVILVQIQNVYLLSVGNF